MPYEYVHAPVYGYLKGARHTIPLHLVYYARTLSILKVLNRVPFSSLLNVGGAEGYHNFLVEDIFGASTTLLDYSNDFLLRSRSMFRIPSVCGDGCRLPFKDNAFDIVTCIEMIEHVPNPDLLVSELKRVARHFVLVSTESYFESEDQKVNFLQYIHETHPQFFRRKDPAQPSDVSYFTKKDFEETFASRKLRYFPQFDKKRKERLAPIEEVRDLVREMTPDIPINRSSRIIVLFSHEDDMDLLPDPHVPERRLLEATVTDTPCVPLEIDPEMQAEDRESELAISQWWRAEATIASHDPENLPVLALDEEGAQGVTMKWITADNLDASPHFCIREMSIQQGGYTARHDHSWEHQLFILEGKGRILKSGRDDAVELVQGHTVRIPPRTPHQVFSDQGTGLKYLDIIPSVTRFFGR